jgi:hypothetical protein
MEMTLIYARTANRVVADEYAAVSAKIDALYGRPPALPADYETTGMARLRRGAHARMLGNGLCTPPAELDCRMESACETCAYFRTGETRPQQPQQLKAFPVGEPSHILVAAVAFDFVVVTHARRRRPGGSGA